MSADMRGALAIVLAFGVVLVVAEVWARRGGAPERTRKVVHIGGSAIGVFMPLLVRSVLVAFVLTASLSLLFFVTSRGKLLRSVGGVSRPSRGSEYYPLAVWLVFVLADGEYWRYLASLLVLGIADAFAALAGSSYGRIRYRVEEESKSVEGSLVFLVVAYLAILLPMLLLTGIARPVAVLASLLVALIVTVFEAISLEGADNLFVPVAACVILGKITTKPLTEVIFQNVSFVVLTVVIGFAAWRVRALNVGATIGVLLFAYGLWSLGSPVWTIPFLVGCAAVAAARVRSSVGQTFGVRPVARACIPLVAILVLANSFENGSFWFGPYLAALAALTASGVVRVGHMRPRATLIAVAAVALIVVLPTVVVPATRASVWAIGGLAAVSGVASGMVAWTKPGETRLGGVVPALEACAAAGLLAALQYEGVLGLWQIG